MPPPAIIAQRFSIEREVGSGGMGTVYRGVDLQTGAAVAVKVLRDRGSPDLARFAREARVLAELDHPALVRYVAHGLDAHEPYLVMEWLEGEDLGRRLERGRASIAESVAVARRAADGLATVHARGVVHRDVKPSNLFLVGGSSDSVKLIDFGMARMSGATQALTQSGSVIGTPHYMAPEQARGARDVDARADVYSLGCVLFHCLTGQTPFAGAHLLAVLAKVLLEETPRVSDLRAEVPEPLDALVERMLSKDPARRPESAAAVALELAAIDLHGATPRVRAGSRRPPALTEGEQRLVSVLLVGAGRPDPASDAPLHEARTEDLDAADWLLLSVLGETGVQLDHLADGSRVVMLTGGGAATDQASAAARCALGARAARPGLPMALATGRGRLGGQWPVGDAIDRAVRLLQRAPGADDPAGVLVDELTAALLEGRFDVAGVDERVLLGRSASDGARTLLGRPTAFVGRERELRAFEELFDECVSEPAARVVLVTAEAGAGKSRLGHELIGRVRARGEPIEVWRARGSSMCAGAPFGLVGQMVRGTARILEGEPLDARQRKLLGRVSQRVEEGQRRRVAAFLGEMVGTPFPDAGDVQLHAARRDPRLLGDQMRRAWVDLVDASCRGRPLVLVLDDLQWGDQPSVECVDAALRALRDRPLMVLGLARPEVHERLPRLWRGRAAQELQLGGLSRRACERLARDVLGEASTPELVASLWERSAGNAFFLEELLRATAEGRGENLPETVLAMVQSRLAALDPEDRRLLRAASVFGEVFWRGGLAALLGGARRLDERLEQLEAEEWITRRSQAKFHEEEEYVFRHALVRDAAHGMLTDEDRTLGHRLAGAWLEGAGEADALVLAEHLERGGETDGAVRWYCRAAEEALEGNDLASAVERVERATALGASGEALGELSLVRAIAHNWRGEHPEAERWGLQALGLLPRGRARWCSAVAERIWAAGSSGEGRRVAELGELVLAACPVTEATGSWVVALTCAISYLLFTGLHEEAGALHEALATGGDWFRGEPEVGAALLVERALFEYFADDPALVRELLLEALARYEEAGDLRNASLQRGNVAGVCNDLGAYAEAESQSRVAIAEAERLGLAPAAAGAKHTLGLSLARRGALDEARAVLAAAIEEFAAQGNRRLEGGSRTYQAAALKLAGELGAAEAEARRAVETLATARQLLPAALATLADVLLGQGRAAEALEQARHAGAMLEALGRIEEGESLVRLVNAEALAATGDCDAARPAIALARDRLLARAARIRDEAWRRSFLERIPEHARTLELAQAWLGE